jgi:hypothetical protein
MTFAINGSDVSGSYQAAVGGAPRRVGAAGFESGDLIAFTANFGAASLASWTGRHSTDHAGEAILLEACLGSNVPDASSPSSIWGAKWSAAGNFVRTKPSHCP